MSIITSILDGGIRSRVGYALPVAVLTAHGDVAGAASKLGTRTSAARRASCGCATSL